MSLLPEAQDWTPGWRRGPIAPCPRSHRCPSGPAASPRLCGLLGRVWALSGLCHSPGADRWPLYPLISAGKTPWKASVPRSTFPAFSPEVRGGRGAVPGAVPRPVPGAVRGTWDMPGAVRGARDVPGALREATRRARCCEGPPAAGPGL